MADIEIIRAHSMGLEQARVSAIAMARDLAEQYAIEYQWQGNTLVFTRQGVDGVIQVEATSIVVSVTLGFMLGIFRAGIEQSIHDHLDRLLT